MALGHIAAAVRIDPRQPAWHSHHGLALFHTGDRAAALASFDRAIALRADQPDAHSNRAMALHALGRYPEALESADRALFLDPRHVQALNNRGLVLRELDRCAEGLAAVDRALALAPDFTDALASRAALLLSLNRPAEAAAVAARVLAARPASPEAHWTVAIASLTAGDFARGLPEYEWRWQRPECRTPRRDLGPPWLGDVPVAGQTVLIHAEQGFGDSVQFSRYAGVLARQGARVILEVQPELVGLLATVPGAAEVVAWQPEPPAHDLHCPLLSLPLACGTTLETIPAAVPYVAADPTRVADWSARLGPRTRPRVGLVWAGSVFHTNDRRRSIPLALLRPLLDAGIEVVSLQRDVTPADRAWLAAEPRLRHWGDELEGFAATAAAIAALDLLVTVDTAPAHVAGALGRPVWLLLPFTPDYRWLLDRDDTPWYPTARLFRQPAPGDWAHVIARVGTALRELAAT